MFPKRARKGKPTVMHGHGGGEAMGGDALKLLVTHLFDVELPVWGASVCCRLREMHAAYDTGSSLEELTPRLPTLAFAFDIIAPSL